LVCFLQRLQGAQHRHAGRVQGRELPREDCQLAHIDAAPALHQVLDVERVRLLADVEDDQATLT